MIVLKSILYGLIGLMGVLTLLRAGGAFAVSEDKADICFWGVLSLVWAGVFVSAYVRIGQ